MKAGKVPAVERQPADSDGLVFSAPWEAKTFAMAVHLHDKGVFSWKEWAEILAGEISAHEAAGATVDSHNFYQLWQSALEKVIAEKV